MKITEILQKNAEAAKKYIDTLLKKKQDALAFDTIPTADSKNPVTSDGIKKAIDACPDKNGTGARGTWPISVGGSSAIATKAKQDADGNVIPNTYVKRCEELVCTLDDLKIGGSYAIQTGDYITVDPTYTDIGHPGSVLVIMNKANGATNSCTQIYTTYDTHNSYKREYDAVKKTWSAWRKYAFEDSTVAKAQKLATARKINITGNASGSVTFDGSGDVSINTTVNESKHAAAADKATTATKVNATAPNGGTADLVLGIMANDDSARIRIGGSNDNGWLEIATSDNGNEPIYARQYSGGFVQDEVKSVTNEAVLLDTNGNTKFPHDVTATNFVGHLAGTADNADTVDGIHAASLFYNKGDWSADNWGTIGAYQVNNNPPVSDAYGWGQVISSSTTDARFQLYVSHQNANGRLHYKTGWDNDKSQPWETILDSENYNLFAPTKTGTGASGTWGINITGNAATATKALNVPTSDVGGNIWIA